MTGKPLRARLAHSPAEPKKMPHLALSPTQRAVILHEQVGGQKHTELSIVSQFLTPILVKGRSIWAAGLHTKVGLLLAGARVAGGRCPACQWQSSQLA